eukprot:14729340-Alexandrium_andersonii.AAC.1
MTLHHFWRRAGQGNREDDRFACAVGSVPQVPLSSQVGSGRGEAVMLGAPAGNRAVSSGDSWSARQQVSSQPRALQSVRA